MSDASTAEDYAGISDRARRHAEDNGWRFYERDMGFGFKRLGWHRYDESGGGHSLQTGPGGAQRITEMLDHDDRCAECGAWIEWGTAADERLRAAGLCFTCEFYQRHVNEFSDRDAVIQREDGSRWGYHVSTVGLSSRSADCRGFAGRTFHIRFHDGREVTTNDLWCWGTDIPERFYNRLPVNAEFVPAAVKA